MGSFPSIVWEELNKLRPAIADCVAADIVYDLRLQGTIPIEKMVKVED